MGIPKQVMDADAKSAKAMEEDAKAALGEQVADAPKGDDNPQPQNTERKPPEQNNPPNTDAQPPNAQTGKAGLLDSLGSDDDARAAQRERVDKLWASRLDAASRERKEALAEAERMKGELASRDEEIAALKQQLADLADGKPKSALDGKMLEFLKQKLGDGYSDEELGNFAEAIGAISDARTKGIREELAAQKRNAAASNAVAFKQRLEAEFPGFLAMDANDDPRWVAFCKSSLGGVMEGTTYGDIAKSALKGMDYRRFAAIVREFAAKENISFSPDGNGNGGDINGQIRPRSVRAGASAPQKRQPSVFPRSEVNRFYRAYQARRAEATYGLTSEQVAERIRLYEDAESEGRVDESR